MIKIIILIFLIISFLPLQAKSLEEKLIETKKLYEKKLISEKEYKAMRKEILFDKSPQENKNDNRQTKKYSESEKNNRFLILPFSGIYDYKNATQKIMTEIRKSLMKKYKNLLVVVHKPEEEFVLTKYTPSKIKMFAEKYQCNTVLFGYYEHFSITEEVTKNMFGGYNKCSGTRYNIDFKIYSLSSNKIIHKGSARNKYYDPYKAKEAFVPGVISKITNYILARFIQKYPRYPE